MKKNRGENENKVEKLLIAYQFLKLNMFLKIQKNNAYIFSLIIIYSSLSLFVVICLSKLSESPLLP